MTEKFQNSNLRFSLKLVGTPCRSIFFICLFVFQEFGDSARARKLYEQDSDDDDDEEIEPNPKLEQGELIFLY